MQYTVEKSGTIHLGKQGEHRTRKLMLPELAAWEAEYGPGEAEIIFLLPGTKEPVSITPARAEDGAWSWTVTASETARPGYGKCELRYTAEGAVVKSATYQTYVAESLGEGVSDPESDQKMDPDSAKQEHPAEMPLLTDAKSGTSYALGVDGGKLMIQAAKSRAGDQKTAVMESDRAIPGGVATLDESGRLAADQRPDCSISQVEGLEGRLSGLNGKAEALQAGKQDKITGIQGQIVGFDESGSAIAQEAPDTGVMKFNGRTGDIAPQDGDYTAAMVNARPDTWTPAMDDVSGLGEALSLKQDKLTGAPGQLIGIGDDDAAQAMVYPSNPNLLDNWYFSRPVNQRGETSYSGPFRTYGIDRWYGTNTSLTISVEDGYVHYSQTGNGEYRQELDGMHDLAGKTVTLSLLIEVESGTFNMSIYAADGVGNSVGSSVSGLQLLTVTYTMPATIKDGITYKYPLVRFFGIANAKLYASKLELGSVQTLAHKEGDTWVLNDPPPNYALELAKCQRYYVYFDRYRCVGCVTNSATEYRMAIQLPVPMRIVPTVSMAGWNGRIASGGYTVRSGNGYSTPNQLHVNSYGNGACNITVSDHISLQDVVDVNNSIIYYEIADLALNAEL